MSLRRRLDALERILERMDMDERCPTCGFPGSIERSCSVILALDGSQPPRCRTCDHLVDENGHTRGRRCIILWGETGAAPA